MAQLNRVRATARPFAASQHIGEIATPTAANIPLLEHLFIGFALLMFTRAIVPVLRYDATTVFDPTAGDSTLRYIYVSIFVVTMFLILSRLGPFIQMLTQDYTVIVLMLLPLISVLWSIDPNLSLRRSIALLVTTVFGVYLASRYSLEQLLTMLAWLLGISMILSIAFAVLAPEYGVMSGSQAGSWRGIYIHKNYLGRTMNLAFIVFALLALSDRRHRLGYGSLALLSCVPLYFAQSAGAMVMLLVSAALIMLARIVQQSSTNVAPTFIVIALLAGSGMASAYADFSTVLGILGKDETFTGRTELWQFLIQFIRERPWLGFGYDGFWRGWNGPSADVWAEIRWQPPHAHNNLIDIWLSLGLVGVTLVGLNLLRGYRNAIRWSRAHSEYVYIFPILFLAYMVLASTVYEPTFLQQNNFLWIIYVTVICILARHPDEITYGLEHSTDEQS